MIRVAVVTSEHPPFLYGGLGTHVCAMTRVLAARGAHVDLVVPRREGYQPPPPGVELHQVDVGHAASDVEFWLRFCHGAIRVGKELAGRVDLVHAHDWMAALAGAGLRARLGVPLVLNVHLPQTAGAPGAMEALGRAWAECVLVNSRAVRAELASRVPVAGPVKVIPNGVDLNAFTPRDTGDDGYVLFVGRLVSQKGADVAVRALGVLLERLPDARLVVAGDGDQGLFLRRLARDLGIPDRVSFVGWHHGPALVGLYQRARVVVMPSRYEPFGIVGLEAMACGRPVVASRTGGLEEVVEDGVTGFLVRPDDYLGFARRLAPLLLDPELAVRVGTAGRRRATAFSWEAAATRTERMYRRVVRAGLQASPAGTEEWAGELADAVNPPLRPLVEGLLTAARGRVARRAERAPRAAGADRAQDRDSRA